MKTPPPHPREALRLNVMRDSGLLDRSTDGVFDDYVLIASAIAGTPIALLTMVDGQRQWFKARTGLAIAETPRDVSFCAHAILDETRPLVVTDATQDDRFAGNPLVTGEPGIRFYLGVPLLYGKDRLPVGTICVIDRRPRLLDNAPYQALVALGRVIERQMAKGRT